MLNYLELDDAMKVSDVGRMQDILPRLLFRFAGGKNKNYTIEVLELLQGLQCEWPDDLKYEIFTVLTILSRSFIVQYCWLVNTTGKSDRFLPIDLLQEHNVRDIKVNPILVAV